MVNQQFRKDYWIKGPRLLDSVQQHKQLRQLRIILVTPREDVELTVAVSFGEAKLNENVYTPLLDILADHETKTIEELEVKLKPRDVSFAQIVQALVVLGGMGHTSVVQDGHIVEQSLEKSNKLNEHLLVRALGSPDISFLGSPLIGGGISVSRVPQLFLKAYKQGAETPDKWADFAWQALSVLNQRLVVEGKTLENPADNLKELNRQAQEFQTKRMPIMKALKII